MAEGSADISTIRKVGRPNVVIVTGISGAGKSTALRALEDAGFFAVDNPPLPQASALTWCSMSALWRTRIIRRNSAPLTSLDRRVNEFVETDPSYDPFMKKLEYMVAFLLTLYNMRARAI